MDIKEAARRCLGNTPVWRGLSVARYRMGRAARSSAVFGRLYGVLPQRFVHALLQPGDVYDADYFDLEKDASRQSGYGAAYADMQEFHDLAGLALELFHPASALDIGCARGYQVRALRELGVDAWGIDISSYVVGTAPPEVSPYLEVRGCRDTGFPDRRFDLVLLLETLEHLPPHEIDAGMEEARRVCDGHILATIPSIGANPYGPDGVTGGKVRERFLPLYEQGTVDLVSPRHLARDSGGFPIHGHLIAASFDWWTGLFTRHGLVRRGDLEARVNAGIACAGDGTWNCYVLARADNPAGAEVRRVQLSLDWEEVGEGHWTAGPVLLPAGLHHADLSLRCGGTPGGKRRLHRVLRCACISGDGRSVLGMRTFTRRELPTGIRDGMSEVRLALAAEEEREVRFEVRGYAGLRPEPLRPGALALFGG